MVEFAIVAGLILTPLVLGILEFGFAAWAKNSVAADAREGARYAVVHGSLSGRIATPDSVSNYVKSRSTLDAASLQVYTVWPTNKNPGSTVEVSVRHSVPRRGPFIPAHTDSVTSKMVILF